MYAEIKKNQYPLIDQHTHTLECEGLSIEVYVIPITITVYKLITAGQEGGNQWRKSKEKKCVLTNIE